MASTEMSSSSRLNFIPYIIAVLLVIHALTNASSGKGGTVLAPGQGSSSNAGNQPANIGQPSKNANCVASGGLQDKACTPGAIIPDATVQQICTPGYSSSVRNVPTSEKDQVYAEYGIASHFSGQYEVDHLISLELGGSNDISNLLIWNYLEFGALVVGFTVFITSLVT